MRAIVLVKQVPDVRADSVELRADGTIDRGAAPAITNPADLHALEAALRLADEVWAISMGPPQAASALEEAVSLGAQRAVLLCDRAFAGSDTWATANALAAAIEHVGGADLILCGITALDGETGQVGPQVAQRLGLPQATGCEDLEVRGDELEARRIVEGGFEVLAMPLPALATIAETGFEPRYATFPGRRRAADLEVTQLTAADIGLETGSVGLDASPTKVARMRSVPVPKVTCRFVDDDFDYHALVADLDARGALDSSARVESVGTELETAPPTGGAGTDTSGVRAGIWVACEFDDDRLARVSAELLTKAGELAAELETGVAAYCAGTNLDRIVGDAARFGAETVVVASDPRLSPYRAQPHARVLADAARRHRPDAILLGATTTGRDLAPRVAAILETGLAADCTDLTIDTWQHRGETYDHLLHQERPAMSGSVLATCICPRTRPQMASVRPGVFVPEPNPRRAKILEAGVDIDESDLRVEVRERRVRRGDVALADADIIVAGGAGCDADSWHLVEDLADALGANVGASRGAVEAGLAPRGLQVGQTGTTVNPGLYIACGISGALQHVVGMRRADTIVAINREPDAAIFRFAEFGIVDDIRTALPQLTEALRQRRHG